MRPAVAAPAAASEGQKQKSLSLSKESSRPRTEELVERCVALAFDRSKDLVGRPRVGFTKSAKRDLAEAIDGIGNVTWSELSQATVNCLQIEGRDDFARAKFGTDLAATLVASIQVIREQREAEQKRQADAEAERQQCSELEDIFRCDSFKSGEGEPVDRTGTLRLQCMAQWIVENPEAAKCGTALNLIQQIRAKAAKEAAFAAMRGNEHAHAENQDTATR